MARLKIQLDPKLKASLKDASVKLTGASKRAFTAKATQDYFNGSPRQAETYMGWLRKAVATGLKELETGLICQDNHQGKGRKKTEEKIPQLAEDIRSIVDDKAQADPQSLTVSCYTRISARAVKEALITEKGYRREELPSRQTIGKILNRMGYRFKKCKK